MNGREKLNTALAVAATLFGWIGWMCGHPWLGIALLGMASVLWIDRAEDPDDDDPPDDPTSDAPHTPAEDF